ncbi:MAG: hypothetical protein C0504_11355, partial [Candidatus Solibacter sp.]|nr:hypothetical protein [Candidatus Solibacter sp.]
MRKCWAVALALSAMAAGQEAAKKEWEISGVVRSGDAALKGATMSINGPQMPYASVKTDGAGRYRFTGTLHGTYTVRMHKPEDASEARPRTVTVGEGAKLDGVDFNVPKGAVIAGRVVDEAGRAVPGMVVEAFEGREAAGRRRLTVMSGAVSNDRGEFRIAHLPPGRFRVAAVPVVRKPLRLAKRQGEAPQLAPAHAAVTFAPGVREWGGAAVFEVAAGDVRQGADIVMRKEPVYCLFLTPRVAGGVEAAGLVVGVTVMELVGGAIGPQVGGGREKAGDEAQLCGLPEGDYVVMVFAYTREPMKGYGMGMAEVRVGKKHQQIGVVEAMGARDLAGRVRVRGAKTGETLAEGMRISLALWNRGIVPSDRLAGRVETDGRVTLESVFPDTYGFRLENLPRGHYVASVRQGGQDVAVAGVRPGETPVEIELDRDGPVVSGRVTTGGERPVAVVGATVLLVSEGEGRVAVAQSDQDGVYRFESGVAPGEYRIVAVEDSVETDWGSKAVAGRWAERGT